MVTISVLSLGLVMEIKGNHPLGQKWLEADFSPMEGVPHDEIKIYRLQVHGPSQSG